MSAWDQLYFLILINKVIIKKKKNPRHAGRSILCPSDVAGIILTVNSPSRLRPRKRKISSGISSSLNKSPVFDLFISSMAIFHLQTLRPTPNRLYYNCRIIPKMSPTPPRALRRRPLHPSRRHRPHPAWPPGYRGPLGHSGNLRRQSTSID